MPILLFRVDDRLIHGQVIVGWGAQLGVDFIAVVDDQLASSEWEQDLYRAGLPETIEAHFLGLEAAAETIQHWSESTERGFVLTRDVETMRRLAEGGVLNGKEINLGGLHDAPGRRRVLPYLFLSDDDWEQLRRLARADVQVSARDVPSARKIELKALLQLRTP